MRSPTDPAAFSRRTFLAAMAGLALAGVVHAGEAASQPAIPNRFHPMGGLVVLPDRGALYIAADFHARWEHFCKWLEKTDLVAKLKGDENAYGLILGDMVDLHGADSEAEPDGDSRIIDRIREIQAGAGGQRFVALTGNHERECAAIYAWLKQNGRETKGRADALERLYAVQSSLQQFNFAQRMTEEHYQFIRKLPLAVLAKNGVVACHGGPSWHAKSTDDVAKEGDEVVQDMVWGRPQREPIPESNATTRPASSGVYTIDDVDEFLRMMDGSTLLICGHTEHPFVPEQWLRDGVAVFGKHEIILATSYGAMPGGKRYLVLDLSKRYRSVADVTMGKEIQRA